MLREICNGNKFHPVGEENAAKEKRGREKGERKRGEKKGREKLGFLRQDRWWIFSAGSVYEPREEALQIVTKGRKKMSGNHLSRTCSEV